MAQYFRFTNKNTVMSDWGHAMFSSDIDEVEGYGRYGYTVSDDQLVDINSLRDEMASTLNAMIADRTIENYFEDWFDDNFNWMYDVDTFIDSFNPDNIVDSADAWDNDNSLAWFWDKIAAPKHLKGIITKDGAIVFDASICQKLEIAA